MFLSVTCCQQIGIIIVKLCMILTLRHLMGKD